MLGLGERTERTVNYVVEGKGKDGPGNWLGNYNSIIEAQQGIEKSQKTRAEMKLPPQTYKIFKEETHFNRSLVSTVEATKEEPITNTIIHCCCCPHFQGLPHNHV